MSDFSGTVMTGRSSQIKKLKAQARSPGEASFFYADNHFKYDAVKVLPGEYFVASDDILITTVLGSCIAACIWDGRAQTGGMNHFMLPEGDGGDGLGPQHVQQLQGSTRVRPPAAAARHSSAPSWRECSA